MRITRPILELLKVRNFLNPRVEASSPNETSSAAGCFKRKLENGRGSPNLKSCRWSARENRRKTEELRERSQAATTRGDWPLLRASFGVLQMVMSPMQDGVLEHWKSSNSWKFWDGQSRWPSERDRRLSVISIQMQLVGDVDFWSPKCR